MLFENATLMDQVCWWKKVNSMLTQSRPGIGMAIGCETMVRWATRKASVEAGIRQNAIWYKTKFLN